MISLDRNLSETWTIINSSSRSPSKESRERVEFLNFQLQKLVSNMPTDDFAPLEPTVESPEWLRLGLKLFCRLRVHHIKMLSHVGSFDSMRDLISQPQSARALVTSAAEAVEMTLEMISNGAKTSPLLLPSALKFLLSSLSFMLLVVSHYSTQYRALCSKPFYAAIDILNKMQDVVKDPSLNIRGTLQEMRKIAGVIQLSPPPLDQSTVPFSFIDAKQGVDGTANTEQTFATPNMFDELQTPNSDFFSNLGDVNISGADSLYMNMSNMFD